MKSWYLACPDCGRVLERGDSRDLDRWFAIPEAARTCPQCFGLLRILLKPVS